MSKQSIQLKKILYKLLLILIIPTGVVLYLCLDSSLYYVTSMILVILTLALFFLSVENNTINTAGNTKDLKQQTTSLLVMSAVFCALAVVGRSVFIAIPYFKPLGAIVIISGIVLGKDCGFLVGSLSMFVSNFLFVQGPWTAWQMLAFGILGFMSGVLFYKKNPKPIIVFIYGFLSIQFIIGPILDISSVLLFLTSTGSGGALTVLLAGVPVNFTQAISTLLFLILLYLPLIKITQRIKTKYGIQ